MKVFTIGFTKKSAKDFFTRLMMPSVKTLIDVRLNNVSQLSGFAKRDDLKYFTTAICGIKYEHMLEFAPTKEMLDTYRKKNGSWSDYEKKFVDLMSRREIEKIDQSKIDGGCLLCSEDKPHFCHRRLVAEYLRSKWGDLEVIHL